MKPLRIELSITGSKWFIRRLAKYLERRGVRRLGVFSKEERLAFEQLMEDFEDALVMSHDAYVLPVRRGKLAPVIWGPQPYMGAK